MPEQKRTGSRSASAGRSGETACPVGFCPVGMFLTVAGQARPEVMEHLLAAGRELVLAASAVLNARAETLREDRPRVERIEVT